ncbi:FAD-dependent oxidoreductase [Streptomyces hydrogenans]|uniref:FAD-dependent oxidoreductase n=1 Tax=Streptomyces hydrogenans TaxID=1873719 RepID=UPI001CFCC452|nr:FAD-dependent oxidoreductase [Streptomyces hydrogenans]
MPFPVAGAVRVEDQARFHPLAYLRGLVDGIVAGGGRTHEGTRVVELDRGTPHRLTTGTRAVVSARHVVVAAHHPVFAHALLATGPTRHRDAVAAGPGGVVRAGQPSMPVVVWAAPTGLDSGEPRWRR